MVRLSPETVTEKTRADSVVHGARDELYRCNTHWHERLLRLDLSDDEISRASTSSSSSPKTCCSSSTSPMNGPSDGTHEPGNQFVSAQARPSPARQTVIHPFYTAMAKGIREKRERCLAELATKTPEPFLSVDNSAHRPASAIKPRSDDRTVRGVVMLQADPSSTKTAVSVLLDVSKGVILLQDLTRDFQELLCLQLRHVMLKTVPLHDNMLRIMVKTRTRDPQSQDVSDTILVALPDRSLRDRWLEALSDMGVSVQDWRPTQSQRTHKESTCHRDAANRSCLNGALAPVRWIA